MEATATQTKPRFKYYNPVSFDVPPYTDATTAAKNNLDLAEYLDKMDVAAMRAMLEEKNAQAAREIYLEMHGGKYDYEKLRSENDRLSEEANAQIKDMKKQYHDERKAAKKRRKNWDKTMAQDAKKVSKERSAATTMAVMMPLMRGLSFANAVQAVSTISVVAAVKALKAVTAPVRHPIRSFKSVGQDIKGLGDKVRSAWEHHEEYERVRQPVRDQVMANDKYVRALQLEREMDEYLKEYAPQDHDQYMNFLNTSKVYNEKRDAYRDAMVAVSDSFGDVPTKEGLGMMGACFNLDAEQRVAGYREDLSAGEITDEQFAEYAAEIESNRLEDLDKLHGLAESYGYLSDEIDESIKTMTDKFHDAIDYRDEEMAWLKSQLDEMAWDKSQVEDDNDKIQQEDVVEEVPDVPEPSAEIEAELEDKQPETIDESKATEPASKDEEHQYQGMSDLDAVKDFRDDCAHNDAMRTLIDRAQQNSGVSQPTDPWIDRDQIECSDDADSEKTESEDEFSL